MSSEERRQGLGLASSGDLPGARGIADDEAKALGLPALVGVSAEFLDAW